MDKDYIRECVELHHRTPEELTSEMARLPGDLAFWGTEYAQKASELLRAKQTRDRLHATLSEHHRASLAARTKSKVTVAEVESMVELDPSWERAVTAVVEAEQAKETAWAMVQALAAKRDMLQSIGALMRSEMQSDVRTRG